jgi:hypothetical protein
VAGTGGALRGGMKTTLPKLSDEQLRAAELYDLALSLVAKASIFPERSVRSAVEWIHDNAAKTTDKADKKALLLVAEAILASHEE